MAAVMPLRAIAFASGLLHIVTATSLPRVRTDPLEASALARKLESNGKWWTRIGDVVYHAPDHPSELSPHIKDYYYAIGSHDALSDEMRSLRVGGEGRWHIFHIPKGSSSLLQTAQRAGSRRSSMSALSQLKTGKTLSAIFPEFLMSTDYVNPLSEAGQEAEKKAVEKLSADEIKSYLEKITALPTRSWSNNEASLKIENLLLEEFRSLGYHSCLHRFDQSGKEMANVIAYAPGTSSGSIIVGAHFDSRPFEGAAPGAEDNGSGLAGLLAMAKALQASGVATQKGVQFIAFAGEEAGLLGSARIVADLKSGGKNLPAECMPAASFLELGSGGRWTNTKKLDIKAIVMDEIGWLSSKLNKPTVTLESREMSREMMDHMAHACKDHNGDDLQLIHNASPFGSDHMSFLDHDMQSVLTINGDDEGYPFYHTSQDTIENVKPEFAASITKMNMGALIRMAGVQDSAPLATSLRGVQ